MPVKILKVKTDDDIKIVASLARKIWTEHFTPIITKAQVEYMLANFQSVEAIKSQISSNWEYYLAQVENEPLGYAGIIPEPENSKMMLSKIYIRSSVRGKGLGKSILDYVEEKCAMDKITTLWLTVNKFNTDTVSWYKRRGFNITDEVKKDIGSGFFMDDYIMEKKI